METAMQKDLLADFLHLYHSVRNAGNRLPALLEHFDNDPRRLLDCSDATLRALGLAQDCIRAIRSRRNAIVESDLRWAAQQGNHLLCYRDEAYPELLRQIVGFPALLYARGNPGLLTTLVSTLATCPRISRSSSQSSVLPTPP